MKEKIISLLIATVIIVSTAFTGLTVSADEIKTKEISKGTPVLDGKMDEIWNTTPTLVVNKTPKLLDESLKDRYADYPNYLNDPNIRDVWGTVKVLWDENNLYIYAECFDPKVKDADDRFNVFVSPTNHRTKYQGRIPGAHDPNAPEAYAPTDVYVKFERNKLMPTGPVNFEWIPNGCYDQIKSLGLKQKLTKKVDKWIVEGQIPWSPDIKATIKDGLTIGFDCEIDDQDPQSGAAGWTCWNAPNLEVWHDPSQAGQLVLKNKSTSPDDPMPEVKPDSKPEDNKKPGKDPDKNKPDSKPGHKPGSKPGKNPDKKPGTTVSGDTTVDGDITDEGLIENEDGKKPTGKVTTDVSVEEVKIENYTPARIATIVVVSVWGALLIGLFILFVTYDRKHR